MMPSSTAPSISLTWFARHEIRLAWRDWLAMMTAGRLGRARNVVLVIIGFAALMHLLAYAVVGRFAELRIDDDKAALIVVTASIALAWALMLSQAIESVTRVFYSRADLDLIMSSPVALTNIFSVRIAAMALAITAMALMLSAPFINILAILGGARWLAGYGVVAAGGLSAAAVAIAVTVMLFRLIGPVRTRLVAQIVSAVIGAGFVIALQIAAIVSYGTLSRFAVLTSSAAASFLPDTGSVLWWPGRAVSGDSVSLFALIACSLTMLGATMAFFSPRLGDDVVSASTHAIADTRPARARPFRGASQRRALWHKEFLLLRRDPWLVSQSLMQLLYLIPPAVMLWRGFDDNAGALIILTPVIVMAAGQLSGGLAWLTISGEDASDLVATAPLSPSHLIRAKIDVVLISICVVFAPFVLALVLLSPLQALVTAFGTIIATLSAAAIQLWFRVQAKRSQFRRRQTSSRVATFAEALSSIGWAGTAAVVLSMPVVAIVSGLMTLGVLALAYKLAPKRG